VNVILRPNEQFFIYIMVRTRTYCRHFYLFYPIISILFSTSF